MSKVIFVRSNPVSPEPRVEKEANALGRNGYSVEILAWDRSCKEREFESQDYYTIKRIKLKAPYGRISLAFKLLIWFIYEFKYLFLSNAQIIHACDLDTLVPAILVSKLKNKVLVYDSFDFYAHSISDKVPKIIVNIIAFLEIFLASTADYVILADESRKEQFKNKLKRVIIINNSPEPLNTNLNCIASDNNIMPEIFKIFYAGILDKNRGFKQIIFAIRDIPDIRIEIAGYGLDQAELLSLFNQSKSIKYIGKITYRDVIAKTLASDMLISLYDPKIINNKYASPNKLFEAMMCAKPIIVSKNTVMADIVEREKCGLQVDYSNIDELRNAIINLKNNKALCNNLGHNGLDSYINKYSWKIMEQRLLSLYKNIK